MKKDVLIHVRGLQMMDPEEEQEPIEIVVPDSIIIEMEVIIFVMKK